MYVNRRVAKFAVLWLVIIILLTGAFVFAMETQAQETVRTCLGRVLNVQLNDRVVIEVTGGTMPYRNSGVVSILYPEAFFVFQPEQTAKALVDDMEYQTVLVDCGVPLTCEVTGALMADEQIAILEPGANVFRTNGRTYIENMAAENGDSINAYSLSEGYSLEMYYLQRDELAECRIVVKG